MGNKLLGASNSEDEDDYVKSMIVENDLFRIQEVDFSVVQPLKALLFSRSPTIYDLLVFNILNFVEVIVDLEKPNFSMGFFYGYFKHDRRRNIYPIFLSVHATKDEFKKLPTARLLSYRSSFNLPLSFLNNVRKIRKIDSDKFCLSLSRPQMDCLFSTKTVVKKLEILGETKTETFPSTLQYIKCGIQRNDFDYFCEVTSGNEILRGIRIQVFVGKPSGILNRTSALYFRENDTNTVEWDKMSMEEVKKQLKVVKKDIDLPNLKSFEMIYDGAAEAPKIACFCCMVSFSGFPQISTLSLTSFTITAKQWSNICSLPKLEHVKIKSSIVESDDFGQIFSNQNIKDIETERVYANFESFKSIKEINDKNRNLKVLKLVHTYDTKDHKKSLPHCFVLTLAKRFLGLSYLLFENCKVYEAAEAFPEFIRTKVELTGKREHFLFDSLVQQTLNTKSNIFLNVQEDVDIGEVLI